MTAGHSYLDLILSASVIVQMVLALLLGASVASWAIILQKRRALADAQSGADSFETTFWSGADLGTVAKDLTQGGQTPAGMPALFDAGFREFRRLAQQAGLAPAQVVEGCRRAMRVSQMREMDRLERNLATLATIGSTSPYVGLFGTVWGIMNSFSAIGAVQSATLAMVAPGISEALIATAMGLFAAIPAVIAYNRFADKVTRLEVRLDAFIEEFSAILQRHAHSRSRDGTPALAGTAERGTGHG
jgi:biopolymer transport protein TolQ